MRSISGASTGLSAPAGIYVDTVNNEIGVADNWSAAIRVYGRSWNGTYSGAPLRTISGGSTGLVSPMGLYVDTINDEIGVANSGNASITVYGRSWTGAFFFGRRCEPFQGT